MKNVISETFPKAATGVRKNRIATVFCWLLNMFKNKYGHNLWLNKKIKGNGILKSKLRWSLFVFNNIERS